MRNRILQVLTVCSVVVALALTACTPAGETSQPTTTVPTTTAPTTTLPTTNPPATTPTATPQYGGTITMAWGSDVANLDPYYGSAAGGAFSYVFEDLGIANWTIDRNKFDFTTAYWPIDVMKGNLVESWEQPDQTTIIYHIRKGILWQNKAPVNGRELTADDVVFSFQRILGMGSFTTKSPGATGMTALAITSVTATAKYTVAIKLSKPDFNALEVTLFNSYEGGWIVPHEVVDKYGDFKDWRNWVGTGAYSVGDRVEGGSWTFVKNPNYWAYDERHPGNKLPYADKISALIVPDFSTRLAALRSGKTVIMGGLQYDQADSLKRTNPELVMLSVPGGGANSIAMKVSAAPFNDIRVRQAMQMAIDNDTLVKTYYKGFADATPYGIVGQACLGFYIPFSDWPADVKAGYVYDPTKAKQLLAQAGYPTGFKTAYEISPSWYAMDTDLAQILKTYWAAINVDVDIKVVDQAVMLGDITKRTYPGMTWGLRGSNYNPLAYVKYMAYGGQMWNTADANDPAYNALVDKAYAANTRDEMMDYVKQADLYYSKMQWQIWLPRRGGFTFWQPWFYGYRGEYSMGGIQSGAMFARTWIDSDLKHKLTGIR